MSLPAAVRTPDTAANNPEATHHHGVASPQPSLELRRLSSQELRRHPSLATRWRWNVFLSKTIYHDFCLLTTNVSPSSLPSPMVLYSPNIVDSASTIIQLNFSCVQLKSPWRFANNNINLRKLICEGALPLLFRHLLPYIIVCKVC